MAKVKIQGNASGTGVFTITPPATSTDRTLTLPDSAGTLTTSENFLSTGIDDNASAVKLTVSDTGININGGVAYSGHILPSAHETYDIGSAEYKIRHLFVSDNSLWIGDEHKMSVEGGKQKYKKRKKGKTPKKLLDALVGAGKLFATEAALKVKFKADIHTPAPADTVDPDHADFQPLTHQWLNFAIINGMTEAITPENIFDNTDDFEDESTTTVSASDPLVTSNPIAVGHMWINSTTGNSYICTDITAGANVWLNTVATKTSIEALGIALPAANLSGTINNDRLSSVPASKLTGLKTVGGASVVGTGDITVDTVSKSATVPASPSAGDQWFNTSGSTVGGIEAGSMATYSGSKWYQLSNVPTPLVKLELGCGTGTSWSSSPGPNYTAGGGMCSVGDNNDGQWGSTGFQIQGASGYVQWQLSSAMNVESFAIAMIGSSHYPTRYKLQHSNNGSSWTDCFGFVTNYSGDNVTSPMHNSPISYTELAPGPENTSGLYRTFTTVSASYFKIVYEETGISNGYFDPITIMLWGRN